MTLNVIKTVDGLIIVYSIASKKTFENLDNWIKQLNEITDLSKKPVIIVGNKSDLNENREVSYEEGKKFAENHGYNFYETSASTGYNVDLAFNDIFEQLYKTFEKEIIGEKIEKKQSISLVKDKKSKNKTNCCK